MSDIVHYSLEDAVARIALDDGRANAVSPTLIEDLTRAIERAEKEAGAIALIGRPGRFSAGFDLGVLGQGPDAATALVGDGARLLARMMESRLPIVAGCTGHALAMGALLLLGSDLRIGARGDFKIGLNEVAIRMVLPEFAVHLAAHRLSRRHLLRATTQAEIYDPAGACDAGFLDEAVEPEALEAATVAAAARLAELPRGAFAGTKARLHSATAAAVRETADAALVTP